MTPRRVGYLVGLVVMASAASVLFLSLFRWEWNRALIAGLVFVVAQIGLGTAAILDRLKSIESRLNEVNRPDPQVLATLKENAPPAKKPFAWLTSDADEVGVFIPFILGAGLVVSAVAWLLEHFARATAGPVLEQRLAARLTPVALPAHGLMGTAGPIVVQQPRRSNPVAKLAIVALVAASVWLAIDLLADATQTRPDRIVPGTESLLTIEVTGNGSVQGLEAASALWATCQGTVPSDMTRAGISRVGTNRYSFAVSPSLGVQGERRLRGCLADVTIDNIRASVLLVENGKI